MIDDSKLSDLEREQRAHFVTQMAMARLQVQAANLDAAMTQYRRDAFEASLVEKYRE